MRIFSGFNESIAREHPVLTLGNFDGVHLGHRLIIDELIRVARLKGNPAVVVTFAVHPRMVLSPEKPLEILSTFEEKTALLGESGIDALVILDFDKTFSHIPAMEFARSILVEKAKVSHIIIGYDHAFGHNREGNIDALLALAEKYTFGVTRVAPCIIGEHPVSSSAIRASLSDGDVRAAAAMLGRKYTISGTVAEGKKIGRTIGFPTANISQTNGNKVLPADGVYATRLKWNDSWYYSVTNIGSNPTFGNNCRTIETYCIDFNRSIYNEQVTLEFVDFIRAEKKFSSVDDLVAAIKDDVKRVREKFATK